MTDPSRRDFVLAALGAATGLAAPRTARRPAHEASRFGPLVERLMGEGRVPGASMAVIRDAAIVWQHHFGVRDAVSRAPVDDATLFEAASVSKTVFAYAVLQLCDRDVLSLDRPLVEYGIGPVVPGDARSGLVTARHVLSHTTGLPNVRSHDDPLVFQFTPGERFRYSGEGYWYLQSVVTKLTGSVDPGRCGSYEVDLRVCASDIGDYLRANVLEPLGMRSSAYLWSEAMAMRAARPHDAQGHPLDTARPTPIDAARYAAMGGLRTTAADYARFLIEIMAPSAPARFRLSEAIRRERVRPQVTVDGDSSWALGWQVRRAPGGVVIQHQGGQRGVQAFAAASVARRTGFVILTDSDNGWKVFYDDAFKAAVDSELFA